MARAPAPEPASREALLGAFARLALSRRYRDFGVAAVVATVRVARSTFYYHFAGKDDLLIENLKPLISALAAMPETPAPSDALERWVAHVWEQRGVAGRLLDGATRRRIEAALAAALREKQRTLVAEQIAGGSLALLRAWVGGRVAASPVEMAGALWRGARGVAGATPTASARQDGGSGTSSSPPDAEKR
jgi:AcrR family transcriptional regulator